jgi:sugar-specific transcriptional regulator TrmB
MTEKAKADVEESEDALEDYGRELEELHAERDRAIQEIKDRWGDVVNDVEEVTITPLKKNIYLELFGVAWMPYYLVDSGGEIVELPAFGQE